MANDVSYFKVPGDSTTYSFNDADAENKIGTLETTVADQADSIAANATNIQTNRTAIGTLSSLTTEAQGNLVAAVNEVDAHADANASDISTLNSKFTSYLPTGTNIDSWTTSGFWLYGRDTTYGHAGTFPISDVYGTLICVRGTSTNFAVQMIRSNSISRTDGTLYIRYRSAGTWGSWMTYESNSRFVWHNVQTLTPYATTTANAWEYIGSSITVPAGHIYFLTLATGWSAGQPIGLGANSSNSLTGNAPEVAHEATVVFQTPMMLLYPGTWYFYSKRSTSSTSTNNYYIRYVDMTI